MRIGLDLDGTLYSHPAFFAALITNLSPAGHLFFCISSHGRWEWDNDVSRLRNFGIPADLISPELMQPQRHGDLRIKGRAADHCDFVFDDDVRLQQFTRTPVFAPLK